MKNNYIIGENIGIEPIMSNDFKNIFPEKEVIRWEVLEINDNQSIKIEFIENNTDIYQGIWIACENGLEFNNKHFSQLNLWMNDFKKKNQKEIILNCKTTNNKLSIYNIFSDTFKSNGPMPESGRYGQGMIKENISSNKFRYYCNDFGVSEDTEFDKFSFTIEILNDNNMSSKPSKNSFLNKLFK